MDVLPLYFNEHIVKHYEIDAAGRFSLAALANHVQEDAAEHSRRLNVGYKHMNATNHAWMLSRARFKLISTPQLGSKIETETWVKDYDRMFSYRDFHFKYKDNVFAVANTAWLIINLETKKIVPAAEFVQKVYKLKDRCLLNDPIPKLRGVEGNAEHVFMNEVHFSSIDLNQHVNNVAYLQWYLDYLPKSLALTPIESISVNYLHELKLNEKVNIYYNIRQNNDQNLVTCEMVNAASDQASCRIEATHKKQA
ncbi:MAG: thioesterase [Salinivirgaceae bacterium]|jgi:medium-chain acyl-[acyl-carrier-protein] hydrolase|nr:thioesterase [Salinivirgaceae bacterium]